MGCCIVIECLAPPPPSPCPPNPTQSTALCHRRFRNKKLSRATMSSAQVYPRTGKSISRPLSLGPAPSPPKLAKAFWDRSVSYGVEATTTTFTTTAMNAAGDKTDYRGSCCVPSSIGGGAGGGRPAGGGGGGPTSIGIQIDLDAVVASPTAVVVDSVRRSVPDRILDMLVRGSKPCLLLMLSYCRYSQSIIVRRKLVCPVGFGIWTYMGMSFTLRRENKMFSKSKV